MAEETSKDPFERILQASNRDHLDNPFRTSSELRSRHFPGAGGKLSHTRLVEAYLTERKESSPDWQLLAHGTWPWVIGHAHDLAGLLPDLEKSSGEAPSISNRKQFVEKYSEDGTQEIEVFYDIFGNAGEEFQKAVVEKLKEQPTVPSNVPKAATRTPTPRPSAPAQPQKDKPDVGDLDPITRARMAMIGTLFFFVLSLIPLAIQFWRQPDEDHWIVLGITGALGLLMIACVIDYLRKRP